MSKYTKKQKVAVALGAGAIAIAGGGVALAYWTSTGSGTGTASTTAGSSDLTYSQNTLTAMYPGDSPQALTVTVTNGNASQSEYVGGVSAYVTTNKAGCTGADFLLNGSAAPTSAGTAVALAWTPANLAAGGHAATAGTDTIQFNNLAGTNQDACKSATVTLNYTS